QTTVHSLRQIGSAHWVSLWRSQLAHARRPTRQLVGPGGERNGMIRRRRASGRLVRFLTALTLLLAPGLLPNAPPVAAASIPVGTFEDGVAGSLRAAIRAANAAAGSDSIS